MGYIDKVLEAVRTAYYTSAPYQYSSMLTDLENLLLKWRVQHEGEYMPGMYYVPNYTHLKTNGEEA